MGPSKAMQVIAGEYQDRVGVVRSMQVSAKCFVGECQVQLGIMQTSAVRCE